MTYIYCLGRRGFFAGAICSTEVQINEFRRLYLQRGKIFRWRR